MFLLTEITYSSDFLIIQPVTFVWHGSNHCQGAVHQHIVLEYPGQLGPGVAFLYAITVGIEVEDIVNTAFLIFMDNSHSQEPYSSDAFFDFGD